MSSVKSSNSGGSEGSGKSGYGYGSATSYGGSSSYGGGSDYGDSYKKSKSKASSTKSSKPQNTNCAVMMVYPACPFTVGGGNIPMLYKIPKVYGKGLKKARVGYGSYPGYSGYGSGSYGGYSAIGSGEKGSGSPSKSKSNEASEYD